MDNNNIRKIITKIKNKNILTYGENKNAKYQVKKIKYNFNSTSFDLSFKGKDNRSKNIKNINVKLLGKHNALNAAAAFVLCHNLGANLNIAKKSLKNFSGVQRRMTKIFTKNGNDFYGIDWDYQDEDDWWTMRKGGYDVTYDQEVVEKDD